MATATTAGESPSGELQPSSASDFSSAVLRVAVAQICQSVGFRSAQSSALDSLAAVLARYLRTLAGSAAESANSAGRTQCNVIDVAAAIELLWADTGGFPGAWDPGRRVIWSSVPMREIARFVERVEEIPFARPIRRERPEKRATRWRSFGQLGVSPPMQHVPAWLPAFPECAAQTAEGCPVMSEAEEREPERGRRAEEEKRRALPQERERVRFRVARRAPRWPCISPFTN